MSSQKLQASALTPVILCSTQSWNIDISVPSAQEITEGEERVMQKEGENILMVGLYLSLKSLPILKMF